MAYHPSHIPGSEDISWGAGKIHSLKYHFQMMGTGYSYHPALFL
ncbi:MAG: hypothetical protein PUI10_01735 [Prevotellaceae bacterium]|nr:hypothetical protein [Prevotellaceae bacterium]MDY3294953.1 hypothetical protein [Bacteroidaceae bacterium]